MITATQTWRDSFTAFFQEAVKKYQGGVQNAQSLFDLEAEKFLKTIGYTKQELFDFVEDFAKGGEPTLQTALAIATVRRDYFLKEQEGIFSTHRISVANLPSKDAEIEGIGWLPRLIPKAEAKLRGEMPPELMYGCGGDRKFFRTHGLDPADFLRAVWQAHGDQAKIIAWVKAHRSA